MADPTSILWGWMPLVGLSSPEARIPAAEVILLLRWLASPSLGLRSIIRAVESQADAKDQVSFNGMRKVMQRCGHIKFSAAGDARVVGTLASGSSGSFRADPSIRTASNVANSCAFSRSEAVLAAAAPQPWLVRMSSAQRLQADKLAEAAVQQRMRELLGGHVPDHAASTAESAALAEEDAPQTGKQMQQRLIASALELVRSRHSDAFVSSSQAVSGSQAAHAVAASRMFGVRPMASLPVSKLHPELLPPFRPVADMHDEASFSELAPFAPANGLSSTPAEPESSHTETTPSRRVGSRRDTDSNAAVDEFLRHQAGSVMPHSGLILVRALASRESAVEAQTMLLVLELLGVALPMHVALVRGEEAAAEARAAADSWLRTTATEQEAARTRLSTSRKQSARAQHRAMRSGSVRSGSVTTGASQGPIAVANGGVAVKSGRQQKPQFGAPVRVSFNTTSTPGASSGHSDSFSSDSSWLARQTRAGASSSSSFRDKVLFGQSGIPGDAGDTNADVHADSDTDEDDDDEEDDEDGDDAQATTSDASYIGPFSARSARPKTKRTGADLGPVRVIIGPSAPSLPSMCGLALVGVRCGGMAGAMMRAASRSGSRGMRPLLQAVQLAEALEMAVVASGMAFAVEHHASVLETLSQSRLGEADESSCVAVGWRVRASDMASLLAPLVCTGEVVSLDQVANAARLSACPPWSHKSTSHEGLTAGLAAVEADEVAEVLEGARALELVRTAAHAVFGAAGTALIGPAKSAFEWQGYVTAKTVKDAMVQRPRLGAAGPGMSYRGYTGGDARSRMSAGLGKGGRLRALASSRYNSGQLSESETLAEEARAAERAAARRKVLRVYRANRREIMAAPLQVHLPVAFVDCSAADRAIQEAAEERRYDAEEAATAAPLSRHHSRSRNRSRDSLNPLSEAVRTTRELGSEPAGAMEGASLLAQRVSAMQQHAAVESASAQEDPAVWTLPLSSCEASSLLHGITGIGTSEASPHPAVFAFARAAAGTSSSSSASSSGAAANSGSRLRSAQKDAVSTLSRMLASTSGSCLLRCGGEGDIALFLCLLAEQMLPQTTDFIERVAIMRSAGRARDAALEIPPALDDPELATAQASKSGTRGIVLLRKKLGQIAAGLGVDTVSGLPRPVGVVRDLLSSHGAGDRLLAYGAVMPDIAPPLHWETASISEPDKATTSSFTGGTAVALGTLAGKTSNLVRVRALLTDRAISVDADAAAEITALLLEASIACVQASESASADSSAPFSPTLRLRAFYRGAASQTRGASSFNGDSNHSRVSLARPGSARPGSARPGSARPGSARPGSARPGSSLREATQWRTGLVGADEEAEADGCLSLVGLLRLQAVCALLAQSGRATFESLDLFGPALPLRDAAKEFPKYKPPPASKTGAGASSSSSAGRGSGVAGEQGEIVLLRVSRELGRGAKAAALTQAGVKAMWTRQGASTKCALSSAQEHRHKWYSVNKAQRDAVIAEQTARAKALADAGTAPEVELPIRVDLPELIGTAPKKVRGVIPVRFGAAASSSKKKKTKTSSSKGSKSGSKTSGAGAAPWMPPTYGLVTPFTSGTGLYVAPPASEAVLAGIDAGAVAMARRGMSKVPLAEQRRLQVASKQAAGKRARNKQYASAVGRWRREMKSLETEREAIQADIDAIQKKFKSKPEAMPPLPQLPQLPPKPERPATPPAEAGSDSQRSRDFYELQSGPVAFAGVSESKLSGLPSWATNKAYPKTDDGLTAALAKHEAATGAGGRAGAVRPVVALRLPPGVKGVDLAQFAGSGSGKGSSSSSAKGTHSSSATKSTTGGSSTAGAANSGSIGELSMPRNVTIGSTLGEWSRVATSSSIDSHGLVDCLDLTARAAAGALTGLAALQAAAVSTGLSLPHGSRDGGSRSERSAGASTDGGMSRRTGLTRARSTRTSSIEPTKSTEQVRGEAEVTAAKAIVDALLPGVDSLQIAGSPFPTPTVQLTATTDAGASSMALSVRLRDSMPAAGTLSAAIGLATTKLTGPSSDLIRPGMNGSSVQAHLPASRVTALLSARRGGGGGGTGTGTGTGRSVNRSPLQSRRAPSHDHYTAAGSVGLLLEPASFWTVEDMVCGIGSSEPADGDPAMVWGKQDEFDKTAQVLEQQQKSAIKSDVEAVADACSGAVAGIKTLIHTAAGEADSLMASGACARAGQVLLRIAKKLIQAAAATALRTLQPTSKSRRQTGSRAISRAGMREDDASSVASSTAAPRQEVLSFGVAADPQDSPMPVTALLTLLGSPADVDGGAAMGSTDTSASRAGSRHAAAVDLPAWRAALNTASSSANAAVVLRLLPDSCVASWGKQWGRVVVRVMLAAAASFASAQASEESLEAALAARAVLAALPSAFTHSTPKACAVVWPFSRAAQAGSTVMGEAIPGASVANTPVTRALASRCAAVLGTGLLACGMKNAAAHAFAHACATRPAIAGGPSSYPAQLRARINLGVCLSKCHREAEAGEVLSRVLQDAQSSVGPGHPLTDTAAASVDAYVRGNAAAGSSVVAELGSKPRSLSLRPDRSRLLTDGEYILVAKKPLKPAGKRSSKKGGKKPKR